MEKLLFEGFNIVAVVAVFLVVLSGKRLPVRISAAFHVLQVIMVSVLAVFIFAKGAGEFYLNSSGPMGKTAIRFDYLSAWFMLIISFSFLISSFYGIGYMKKYREKRAELKVHIVFYILNFTSLIDLCLVQNSIMFLTVWEIMAISSFIVIVFEWEKKETLKAGINFLIQSHIGILLLTIGFIWVKVKTGSFDFSAIASLTASHPRAAIGLFIVFFTGFAVKAGFVPFHTWLPLAHPAAPAHISGVMSGVIIKIGIFGILRMITLIHTDYTFIGYFVLAVSVITGVYGVMLAIVQHNLKRLLAYHSIENIGIIGMGMGLGCLGMGTDNPVLIGLGFGGALLHTLNHSLFKSLLFFAAGNVYQATHTMNIEALGGMIKKVPHTGYLFLVASLAICGLPPLNGFVSEFFIFKGFFEGLGTNNFLFTLSMLFSMVGLVLVGGLALICFTKAFGVVFLGNSRGSAGMEKIEKPLNIVPLYFIALAILVIGVMPFLFSEPLLQVASLFGQGNPADSVNGMTSAFRSISLAGLVSLGLIVMVLAIFFTRKKMTGNKPASEYETWGCGYTGSIPKAQYTASSFIRTYRKLAEPLLLMKKEKSLSATLYPVEISQSTHPYDKVEYWLIDKPVRRFKRLLNRFVFLQNGNIQYYILYGFIFITLVFVVPVIISKLMDFISFIK
ncbi:MAG: proton-conducting transporter membrane subunit [Bacteroidota bacterium]